LCGGIKILNFFDEVFNVLVKGTQKTKSF